MKLIVLSNPDAIVNEHSILTALFENGLSYFHLRKPSLSEKEFETYLKNIPSQFHNKIVLHTYHSLALHYNIKGIHYSGENPFISKIENLAHLHQSISCHTFDELKEVPTHFDYAFISPIFDSISKMDYPSQFANTNIKEELSHISNVDTIALGGIDNHTILKANKYGFEGVGVLGGIWMDKDAVQTFIELHKTCKELK